MFIARESTKLSARRRSDVVGVIVLRVFLGQVHFAFKAHAARVQPARRHVEVVRVVELRPIGTGADVDLRAAVRRRQLPHVRRAAIDAQPRVDIADRARIALDVAAHKGALIGDEQHRVVQILHGLIHFDAGIASQRCRWCELPSSDRLCPDRLPDCRRCHARASGIRRCGRPCH